MGLDYDPLWDEQGQLRRGCTVREALAWLTKFGSHSAGENVCINGISYKKFSFFACIFFPYTRFLNGVNSFSPSSLSTPSETATSRTSWAGKNSSVRRPTSI